METTNGRGIIPAADSSSCHRAGRGTPAWLGLPRGLVIAVALTAVVGALALSQHWLAVAGLVPLLFVLPCALMTFMCMKGMNHGKQTDTAHTSATNEAPTPTDTRN
jgi:type IV secretory pathway TrbD component